MSLSGAELDKLAALAHLKLSKEERVALGRDLNATLGFVDKIKAQEDPQGSPSIPGPILTLAHDAIVPSLPREEALVSAPMHSEEAIIAPPLESAP